jgi:hypothetical protein
MNGARFAGVMLPYDDLILIGAGAGVAVAAAAVGAADGAAVGGAFTDPPHALAISASATANAAIRVIDIRLPSIRFRIVLGAPEW